MNPLARISRHDAFWIYAAVSLLFWVLVVLQGGAVSNGDSHLAVDYWLGIALNVGLLLPLWEQRVWAWHALMFIALTSTVVIGMWLYDHPFGLLALLGVLQLALLWRMRTAGPAVRRSTY